MAKRCNSCGFQQNPDNAHYCGKCGKQLSYGENYKLYNASLQTPVYNSTLNNYKKYEKQVNSSWLFNAGDKIKKWWKEDGKDLAQFWMWFILVGGVIFGAVLFLTKSCSSDNKITRIEINGKYGIGYDKDNMLVPATYDSISSTVIGNQWSLYDKNTASYGVAYVTDSIVSIIEPSQIKAKHIERHANGLSVLRLNEVEDFYDNSLLIATKGKYENRATYKRVKFPGGTSNDKNCIVASTDKGGMQLIGLDGLPINGKTYYNIVIDQDSMIRAIDYDRSRTNSKSAGTTTIHDYTGRQTTDKEFYGVNAFSDGVAWACLTNRDRKQYSHSLIDRNGNVLFKNKPNAVQCIEFSEGVGWYAPSYTSSSSTTKFTAVDKKGNDLFSINANKVYPFTMGIAPVDKGSYSKPLVGFVDKTGKEVIPFKYKLKYSNPTFGSDSLMIGVSLNGVEGKLHRNGTFIPNGN